MRPSRLTSAVLIALAALPVAAQEADRANASTLDQVVVTGTHAKDRTVLDSPVPIDVLTPEDLRSAGAVNGELGQALATLLPSFNFPRQSNSGGSDHVRAAQLRGMSPDQVLVLVNGKRFHTSALVNSDTKIGRGMTPVDFNAIPISAIKRIEVLRDGAGAQYGSDAIAGVVNIILDDSPDGGEVNATYGAYHTNFRPGDRTITDGQSTYVSAKAGTKLGGDGGFLRAGFEGNDRQATNRAGPDQIPSWENPSPANLALQGRRNYAAGDPRNENYSGWFNAELPFGDSVRGYAFGTYTQRRTIGDNYFRYPDSDANVPSIYPDGYRPESLGYNRDVNLTAGARGRAGEWDIDGSLTWGRNTFDYDLRNTVNVSLGDESPTRFNIGKYDNTQGTANLDLSRSVEWGSKLFTLATGAEFRHEGFQTYAGDPASYAVGPIVGAPTGAQAGGGLTPQDTADLRRNVSAAYVDLSGDVTDRFFADAAARYEHYDDFGSAWTGKLSGRYAITDVIAIRGAASNNLRAPSLSQVGFESTSTGYGADGTLVQGRILSVNNPVARGLGAKDLKPEKSRNYSLGLTARIGDRFDASLDVYRIDVDHRVTLSETIAPDGLEDYIATRFGVPGVQSVAFFTNAVDTRTRGAELVTNYRQPVYGGNLTLTATYSYNRTSIRKVRDTPAELAALGADAVLFGLEERNTLTDAAPRQRGSFTAKWDSARWSLLTRATRQGTTTRVFDFGDGYVPKQTYAARWQIDAEAEWHATDRLSVALGGQNITDQYPDRSIPDIAYAGNFPYDVISPIGSNGAYWYGRVRYAW
ncbi:iron complex outermembrane receptor protein [Luteibacter sp. 1214]|uniref:TonB-dependent receptor plug domain-containing protein n=1 Tax=Luteibacter sp. 1214 TaxID=2817735 RepID=UPI00285D76B7|nr:TonB-dependent receptor [Luteibacter sp. 1214]MDR6642485.1 iron complex outermembrane receptor protein [Luteibacter sp. 1214]